MEWKIILALLFIGVVIFLAIFLRKRTRRKRKTAKIETINGALKEKINYLHGHLPKQPTAIQGAYRLPEYLERQIRTTNFSQPTLQKVADHIGHFLGLLNSVKVTVGIESSEYMLAGRGQTERADQVGLYKVRGGYYREIQLTKKFRFSLEHILAILAHESTHHYLDQHEISLPGESENEMLTDAAAAYLGLGGLLYKGYQPIQWTTDHWETPYERGHTVHSVKIGYISDSQVTEAVVYSAKLRFLEELAASLPAYYRSKVSSYFKELRRREEKAKQKQIKELKKLSEKLDETNLAYEDISSRMKDAYHHMRKSKMSHKDSKELVEIANALALGEVKRKLDKVSEDLDIFNKSGEIDGNKAEDLSSRILTLSKTILGWHKLVKRHIYK